MQGNEEDQVASVKVTIIGAGSVVFSLHLVKGMCLTPSLAGSTVTFMDINEERLDIIYNMARRYAEDVSADLRLEKTTCREEAIQGADFVVSSVTVNDEYFNRKGRVLADSKGYYYGRSGMFSYYNLQLMLDVARDMERLCPKALLIQAGNPVSTGTTLVTRETSINMVGICHGHYGYQTIAKTLGLDVDKITWQAPGLNHNIWMTDFLRGEGRLPADRQVDRRRGGNVLGRKAKDRAGHPGADVAGGHPSVQDVRPDADRRHAA